MSVTLQTFATGDTDYIAKHNANAALIQATLNSVLTALGSIPSSAGGSLAQALFGVSTALIGSASYTEGTAGSVITISSGFAWRPDLGTVLDCPTSTPIDFTGQPAATYYIVLGADGTPARSSSSTFALYSVVWTGSAFGTITRLVPILPNGDITGNYQTMTIAAGAVTLAKMAALAADSIIGNNTGSPATPLALTPAQVVTLLGAEVTANKGAANGYASLDSGGKVPSAQLPAGIVGALQYQGTWNANTNSPALSSGIGTQGFYYKVSVAGTHTLDGISDWNVGDSVVFDGTTWDKINGADPEVLSVAGKTGAVSLVVGDVSGAAPLASPALTGNPTAPTQSGGDNSTKLATTAYVDGAIAGGAGPTGSAGGDLTGTYPNPTIGANKVTLAKIATIADASILGNNSGGAHIPIELTAAQVKTLLAIAAGDVSGLAAIATSGSAADLTTGTLGRARLPTIRFDLGVCFPGVPTASQVVTYVATRAITIDHTAPGNAGAGTASTGSSPTFTIKKNGVSAGTVLFNASATGAFTVSSDITLAAGDLLTFTAPASPDATLADIAITLAGLA